LHERVVAEQQRDMLRIDERDVRARAYSPPATDIPCLKSSQEQHPGAFGGIRSSYTKKVMS